MKSIIDVFFGMGDKVTKGDPNRQADFVYYMLWILFLAFFMLFASNFYNLIFNTSVDYAVWTLVGFAISGIQFFNLKGAHEMKKMRNKVASSKEVGVNSVEDMLKEFNDKEVSN